MLYKRKGSTAPKKEFELNSTPLIKLIVLLAPFINKLKLFSKNSSLISFPNIFLKNSSFRNKILLNLIDLKYLIKRKTIFKSLIFFSAKASKSSSFLSEYKLDKSFS